MFDLTLHALKTLLMVFACDVLKITWHYCKCIWIYSHVYILILIMFLQYAEDLTITALITAFQVCVHNVSDIFSDMRLVMRKL